MTAALPAQPAPPAVAGGFTNVYAENGSLTNSTATSGDGGNGNGGNGGAGGMGWIQAYGATTTVTNGKSHRRQRR